MKFKKNNKFKAAVLSTAAIATSCLIGLSACTEKTPSDDTDKDKTETKQDVQVIKNGNFEFYSDNDGLYPISSPDNWTSGTTGNSSSAMSGVINTAKKRWDYITDPSLPSTLEENDDLKSDDENKKDYNGALTDDLPYRNPNAALDNSTSDDGEDPKGYIENPFTHEYRYNSDGKILDKDGKEVTTYKKSGDKDEDKLYLDEECTKELETSVLMVHNFRRSYYTGTETYFSSSTTLTLQASTAAKISVWVKTSNLTFDGSKNERTPVKSERGAYIKLATTVGGNSIDDFFINNINTEQVNPDGDNNGWVQYTVFVQASSFAETTLTLSLGLGKDDVYTVDGYAFFDDIEFERYENADQMEKAVNEGHEATHFDTIVRNSTSTPLTPDSDNQFRVDKVTFKTEGTGGTTVEKVEEHNFNDRYFYMDLGGSSNQFNRINLNETTVAVAPTVEETTTGNYVCTKDSDSTKYGVSTLPNGAASAFLPSQFKGVNVSKDVLATVNVGANFTLPVQTDYKDILTAALKSASALPATGGETSAIVMLSANGAAYEADITDELFTLAPKSYALVSFWVKTSDMGGKTAATVTVKQIDENGEVADNSNSFSLDSTTVNKVTVNDKEDVYNGWVQCFARVENTSEENDGYFKISVNFGNTTIKGTSATDYKAGWLAVSNLSVLPLDKDVYSYTSGASHSASLTIADEETQSSNHFDSEQGDKNVIKTDLAIPSSYVGVNGASAEITNKKAELTDYDATNKNRFAGLLNKENLPAYKGCEWYSAIEAILSLEKDEDIWAAIAGKYSVQPLLIVNTVREFKDKAAAVYNYGYVASQASVSGNSYTAVSVRVKVSAGAMANVYLVDTANDKKVLSYDTPAYTFWYDDDGNMLKDKPAEKASVAEQKANIAYKLRADGLYENGDGRLYANFYNLSKYYDVELEHESFFDENGNAVSFENLVQGKTYYANAEKTAYSAHYLAASGSSAKKVYKYAQGLDGSATYYYMVNGKPDQSKVVYGVDTQLAKPRYQTNAADATPYQFTIDATTPEGAAKFANKWVTVTFYLHAGNVDKNYRLELWSGRRDEETTSGQTAGSTVVFDYSSVSLDESTYQDKLKYYVNDIKNEYYKIINDELENSESTIADLEKLAGSKIDKYNYGYQYYTYSLFDAASYVPFNGDTAGEDETGYAYNYGDYSETLAFFKVEDLTEGAYGNEYVMSAFVDYSVVDKDIQIGTKPDTSTDDETPSDTEEGDPLNGWLLGSSIAIVVAMIFAMGALLIRYLIKNRRRNKKASKNSYNFNKNKRYVKQYVKANGTVEEGDVDKSLLEDKKQEPAEAPVEAPAENKPVEEAPVEEQPAEQAPETEQSGDGTEEQTPPSEDGNDEPDGKEE